MSLLRKGDEFVHRGIRFTRLEERTWMLEWQVSPTVTERFHISPHTSMTIAPGKPMAMKYAVTESGLVEESWVGDREPWWKQALSEVREVDIR